MEFKALGINTGIENGFRDLPAQLEQEGVRMTFWFYFSIMEALL